MALKRVRWFFISAIDSLGVRFQPTFLSLRNGKWGLNASLRFAASTEVQAHKA